MSLFKVAKSRLTEEQVGELMRYCNEDSSDVPGWLVDYASRYWSEDIPYGYLNGDDGTVDEWICEHIETVMDHFEEELSGKLTKLGKIIYG